MRDIQFISVPFRAGASRNGVDSAPMVLCDKVGVSSINALEENVFSHHETIEGVKCLYDVVAACKALRQVVAQTIEKGTPIVIGGDHSIALGSVAGSLEHDANLGVVWFDAHADINTERTSPSGNAHGMPVAALMGLCSSALNDVATVRLKPQNMFWVGARDLDPGEKETIERLGIADHVYSTEYIHQIGMQAVMQDIAAKMQKNGIKHWHLSFDIDGMDPILVPATGVPVPNGMNQADVETFIQSISLLQELQSMDFVEYNPLLDNAEQSTGKWCVDIIKRLLPSCRAASVQ